jgi:hypothetical protein
MRITVILISVTIWIFGSTLAFAEQPDKAQCPQNRTTPGDAPEKFAGLKNPLGATEKRIKKGEVIFIDTAQPMQCLHCRGARVDGTGELGLQADPHARNSTCAETMKSVSDGQMFWAIKNGIEGTGMPAYPDLAHWQLCVLIHYVRQFGE